jgi:hypothetical protein
MPKDVKRLGRLTVPGLNIRLTIRFRPIAKAMAELYVRPTADGRANGSADEPRWLRPPAAVEPANGTDGSAGHGSPADPLTRRIELFLLQLNLH